MTIDARLRSQLAPSGTLRAAINVGNPILANKDASTGTVNGVSVELARNLAERLNVGVELVVVDAAGKSVDAVSRELADIGFFAIDPVRGAEIAFTAPYVLIEGCYLVRSDSPIQSNDSVDHPGIRVAVGNASAYDLYLTRELKRASIERAPTSPAVVDYFVEHKLDVAAGVRQQLETDARRIGGLRLLPERFMVIRQAMGLPKSRGAAAAEFLRAYVEEMKTSGFVHRALALHRIEGASLAPAES